jgi:hypothetical protein
MGWVSRYTRLSINLLDFYSAGTVAKWQSRSLFFHNLTRRWMLHV